MKKKISVVRDHIVQIGKFFF